MGVEAQAEREEVRGGSTGQELQLGQGLASRQRNWCS